MSRFERISKRALLLAVLTAATAATSAQAGRYHVYSCRTPSGASAPADGWTGSKVGPYTYAEDTCSQPGGALLAALGDEPAREANTDSATWSFAAPPGTTLAGATLWRAGDADGGAAINATYQFWIAAAKPTQIFDECIFVLGCTAEGTTGLPQSVANQVSLAAADTGAALSLTASCGGVAEYNCPSGKGDAENFAAAVHLYAADLTLEQNAGPAASNVAGELSSAAVVSGSSDLAFSASDPGSGVYQAVFTVDGSVLQTSDLDEDGGRCRDVGQTTDGAPAFLYLQPCLAAVSVDVPFDTTRLANGAHHLLVSITDAAGNAAPVLDRTITVSNAASSSAAGAGGTSSGSPSEPNGAGAAAQAALSVDWKGVTSTRLTVPFGRTELVSGRLTTTAGAPISGARIDVVASPDYSGATALAIAGPLTGSDGTFTMRVPAGASSRILRFAYRLHLGDALPVATRTLTLNVRAGLSMTVAPRVSSVGRSIRFSGRLLGGPVPSSGKLLVLEARAPGGPWIEFKVVRTDVQGHFHAVYRFRFPGPADYQFRVRSESESDYPFGAGASNVVGVHER